MTQHGDTDYVSSTCTRCEMRYFDRIEDSVVVCLAMSYVVEKVEFFCYLGSDVDRERERDVEKTVRDRMTRAWTMCHEIYGLLSNRKVPLETGPT